MSLTVCVSEALLLTVRYRVPHDISRNTRRDLQDEHDAEQDGKLKWLIIFYYTSDNNSILAYFYVLTTLPRTFRDNHQNIHESLVAYRSSLYSCIFSLKLFLADWLWEF